MGGGEWSKMFITYAAGTGFVKTKTKIPNAKLC